jgi:hypothetical protein
MHLSDIQQRNLDPYWKQRLRYWKHLCHVKHELTLSEISLLDAVVKTNYIAKCPFQNTMADLIFKPQASASSSQNRLTKPPPCCTQFKLPPVPQTSHAKTCICIKQFEKISDHGWINRWEDLRQIQRKDNSVKIQRQQREKGEKCTSSKEFSLKHYQEGLQQLSVWISDLAGSIWGTTWPVQRKLEKAFKKHKEAYNMSSNRAIPVSKIA